MKIKFYIFLFYILFLTNNNLLSNENNKILKVGLLAPLSGPYSDIGNSLLNSLQLALEEINDENVIIIPRDSGFKNKETLDSAIDEMRSSGVKVIIGPSTFEEFDHIKKYNDLIFISPSNINPDFSTHPLIQAPIQQRVFHHLQSIHVGLKPTLDHPRTQV